MIKVYQTIECKNNVITTIAFKGVKVKVEFKGGNVMKGIPARLYTKDPFVQKALDESDQKGKMYRFVQELSEKGDSLPLMKVPRPARSTHKTTAETPAPGIPEAAEEPSPGFPEPPLAEDETGAGKSSGRVMEFDNLAEAITYIAATWGEQVESESQARKFIEEKTGVKPVIHKG